MPFKPRFNTLIEIYRHATAAYADQPLFGTKVEGEWRWITYRDFGEQVEALRGGLARLGVGHGDRVAVVANNRVEWAVACYATVSLGGQFVPMYEAQQPKEWRFILENCGAKVAFAAHDHIADTLRAFQRDIPSLDHVVAIDDSHAPGPNWSRLMAEGRQAPAPAAQISADDIAGFIYTSGTTGDPKGVLLSHGNIARNASAALAVFDFGVKDRTLSFLPWAHAFGQTTELHTAFAAGASMAIAESVPKIVDNLAEIQPTVLVAVPRIFNRIYDGLHKRMAESGLIQRGLFEAAVANAKARRRLTAEGERSLAVELKHRLFDRLIFSQIRARFGGRLRFAVSGGAALSPKIAEFIDDLGITVFEGYGLTETSPVVAVNAPRGHRIGTVGRPLPGIKVRLNLDASDVKGEGEIVVYGHNVMQGYFGLPEESAAVFTEDGGFRTGDLGRLDADGFLRITGRIKEKYKLENGKYVVPTPLEEHIKLAPLVTSALVYGANRPYNIALIVPDWEAAAQWAEANGLSAHDPEALLAHPGFRAAVEGQIQAQAEGFKHYERPRRIALLKDEFTPESGLLTPSLKVKRRVVLAKYAAEVEALYT